MASSHKLILAICLPIALLTLLMGIAFNVMALEAYREYLRLGEDHRKLSFSDIQFVWVLSPLPSENPKREAVRQKFLRYQKWMNLVILGYLVGAGILVLCLNALGDR